MKFSKSEILLLIIAGGYMFISPFVFIVTKDFLHAFLAWNMALALIPFLLAKLIVLFKKSKKWLKISLFVLWILFLPNAFYLITDLIYLSEHVFFFQEGLYSPVVFFDHFIPWLALFHIFLGIIISLVFGFHALSIIEDVGMQVLGKKCVKALIIGLLFISSVGIYIGRFFRYNSWHFFSLLNIFKDLYEAVSWNMVFFILGYSVVLIIIYLLFKLVKNLKSTCE